MSDDLPAWSDLDREARWSIVKPLLASGLSMSQVAAKFRGCSRNAIIGLTYRAQAREGVVTRPHSRSPSQRGEVIAAEQNRPQKATSNKTTFNRFVARPTTVTAAAPPLDRRTAFRPLDGVEHIEITELPLFGRCRWPIEAGHIVALACGLTTESNHIYCATHARLSRASTARGEF